MKTLNSHCLWSPQESLYVCNITVLVVVHDLLMPTVIHLSCDATRCNLIVAVSLQWWFVSLTQRVMLLLSTVIITVLCERKTFASLTSLKWKESNTDFFFFNICLPIKGSFYTFSLTTFCSSFLIAQQLHIFICIVIQIVKLLLFVLFYFIVSLLLWLATVIGHHLVNLLHFPLIPTTVKVWWEQIRDYSNLLTNVQRHYLRLTTSKLPLLSS